MLSSRSWQGEFWWKQFQQIKERFPLLRPKLYLPYSELQAIAALSNQLLTSVVREICTLRSVGAGERATAPATVVPREGYPYPGPPIVGIAP